jgi:CRISPR-associated protein Cmr6
MRNLHKYYYKDYFAGADFSPLLNGGDSAMRDLKEKNQNLCSPNLLKVIEKSPLVNTVFTLEIQYPGLVTGVGIKHETKIEGEFKLGVHFDWTHGMPVVYGSSVKGVLRAWFKEFYKPTTDQPSVDDAFNSIFEGKENGKSKSIYNRDIFFDAVIVKADSKGRILASDSITPHGDNPLKNPTPLTFMKIASGCKMEFRFKLVDTIIDGKKFSAAQKKTLFEEILKTVGVGAKTNVGYGQLK